MNPNQTDNLWWRPEKYSPEELLIKSEEYFSHCNKTKVINWYGKEIIKSKSLTWLCLWLKVSKDYISEKLKDERFSEIIKKIRLEVENDIEEWAMIWKYNPTISALNLSSNFNWKPKSEVENSWIVEFIIKK